MKFPKPHLAGKDAHDATPDEPAAPPKAYTPLLILAITALAVAVPFLFINSGKDIIPWRTDLEAAIAEAKTANKPLLINATADWCPPCQTMKRTVFSQATVKDAMEARFIPLRLDMTHRSDTTLALSKRFSIDPIPTYIIITAEGEERGRIIGGMSADEFLAWMKQTK